MIQKVKPAPAWYRHDVAGVIQRMQSHPSGLTAEEARTRLSVLGANRLPSRRKKNPLMRFLSHFNDLLIYILLTTAVLTGLMAQWVDTSVILAVVFINALIAFIQENKAEKSLAGIETMLPLRALVKRDNSRQLVNAGELVPGDIVILQAGDRVPADMRLTEAHYFRVEEAMLTGEAAPVFKHTAAMEAELTIGERENMVFCGSTVLSGSATGIVVATGEKTELGKVTHLMADIGQLRTPLLMQLHKLGRTISVLIVLSIVLLCFCSLSLHKMSFVELRPTLTGLAVAAVPEGLPAIISLILLLGVQTMARKKAMIRKLPKVETLGAMTVICSDQTSMLTTKEMTVKAIADCHRAGVRVKMMTEESPDTAMATGRTLGIGTNNGALTGQQLEQMDDKELAQAACRHDIFSRISPQHKLRLVRALQSQGEVVGMTGDNIGDAPALKQADVGIAMGIKGMEGTRAAADMVLTDDSFATLANAVKEGRRVWNNLKKTILFVVPFCLGQALLLIAATLLGKPMPLTPEQILWVNIVMSVMLSFGLAFETAEPQGSDLKPHKANRSIMDGWAIWHVSFVGALIALSVFLLEAGLQSRGYDAAFIRTVLLQAVVTAQWFYMLNCRDNEHFSLNIPLLKTKSPWVIGLSLALLQLAITNLPLLKRLFGIGPLPLHFWLLTLVIGALLYVIVEIEKPLTRRWRKS